ncbi:MAG: response regulator [Hyphomicrobium sp.]
MTTTVLVVDDITTNVKLLEARLTNENYNVITAYNGADALAICMGQNIDVILSDVMMPHIDGFELCSRLKSNVKTKNIPFILITGLEEECHKAQALKIGADDFLTKPINEVTLLTRVKNLLIQKNLKDEIARIKEETDKEDKKGEDPQSLIASVNLNAAGRILLVDACGRVISRVLPLLSETHNVFVQTAHSQALQTLNEYRFDVLLMHVCESSEETLQFCSTLRANNKTEQLPILLITEAESQELIMGLNYGVNDYVLYPIDRLDVMARLKVQITNKRLKDYIESISKGSTLKYLFNKASLKKP